HRGIGGRAPLLGRRALVAETASRARDLLRSSLIMLGADEIEVLGSGAAVIEKLRARRFDVVMIGHIAGDVYDSQLLLEKIREDRLVSHSSALVAVAADRAPRTIAGIASHGPDMCLIKPLTASQVRLRLLQLVAYKDRLRPMIEALENDDWRTALAVCRLFEADSLELRAAGYRAVCEDLLQRKLLDDAETVLGEARAALQAPWMQLAEARIRQDRGRTTEARDLLERLMGERPDFIASYDTLAGIESQRGEFSVALRLLQEANERTGFSLRRMRSTGEAAVRGGNLRLAEKVLDRVMERVQDSELARASDYVSLVDVLSARGKHLRAEKIASAMCRTQAEDPDAGVAALLAKFRRESSGDDARLANEALGELAEAYRRTRAELSVEMLIQLMETFVARGERELALDAARVVASSGRADRIRLDRVRAVLKG
ncbi:MAG: hypothetical protein KJZ83_23220, partial [Burkholderiaceae bacterium]|nr:hypothetical protein [Burkholderiaceae bacterium]